MCTTEKYCLILASVRNADNRPRKLLRLYQDVVKHLLKKFAKYRAIAEFDVLILRYMQSAVLTTRQQADDLVVRSCKVADGCDEGTLNDVFIEGAD